MSNITISEEEFLRLKAAAGEPISRPTPCADSDHVWKFIGGANGGCCDTCGCSVPVYECVICKASDYGENHAAIEILRNCEDRLDMAADDALGWALEGPIEEQAQ